MSDIRLLQYTLMISIAAKVQKKVLQVECVWSPSSVVTICTVAMHSLKEQLLASLDVSDSYKHNCSQYNLLARK